MARLWLHGGPQPRPSNGDDGDDKPCEGACGGKGGNVDIETVNAYDASKREVRNVPCPGCGGSGRVRK